MSIDQNPLTRPSSLFSNPASELHALFQQALTLDKLQQLVYRYLPLSTQPHIRIAVYRDDVLRLVTDSAQWATKLRYQESELIEKLKCHQSFQTLTHIRITVKPWYAPLREQRSVNQISARNAKQMVTAAKYIEDEPLRKALIKLSLNSADSNMADD